MPAVNHRSPDLPNFKGLIPEYSSPNSSPRAGRTPGLLRVSPIDPFQRIGHLTGGQRDRTTLRCRPDETPALEPFRIQRQADPIMPKSFYQSAAAPPKDEDIAPLNGYVGCHITVQRRAFRLPGQTSGQSEDRLVGRLRRLPLCNNRRSYYTSFLAS